MSTLTRGFTMSPDRVVHFKKMSLQVADLAIPPGSLLLLAKRFETIRNAFAFA